ncbi:MAG: Crp/Fnr family transcriptional regulator [Usitatibacter sp.]
MLRATIDPPITNRLLDRLPARELSSFLAHCERVELVYPDMVALPGQEIRHVYFPIGAVISLMTPTAGRASIQVGLAGNEGMYGVGTALGAEFFGVNASVQASGPAWRIGAAAFRRELGRSATLRKSVLGYVCILLGQLVQTAECSRFHLVEQRLARWLLMTADRAHAPTFSVTHEVLACLLGVRRVGITRAASELQRRKLIAYSRGLVVILDRKGLERASCSCYRMDNSTYDRVFG